MKQWERRRIAGYINKTRRFHRPKFFPYLWAAQYLNSDKMATSKKKESFIYWLNNSAGWYENYLSLKSLSAFYELDADAYEEYEPVVPMYAAKYFRRK